MPQNNQRYKENVSVPGLVFARESGHKIGEVEDHASNVLELNVFIFHECAAESCSGGNAAAPSFVGEEGLVAVGQFALHPQHRLAPAIQASEIARCATALRIFRKRVFE